MNPYTFLYHLNDKYDLIFTVNAESEEAAITAASQELTNDGITNMFTIKLIEIS